MIRSRPIFALITAWVVGAVASVGVGLLALSLVGETFGDESSPLLAADTVTPVESPQAISQPTPGQLAPTGGSATATALPQTGPERLLTSAGGSVVARCHGTDAYLVYWTPAQGYRAHDVERGPAGVAKLKFEGQGREYELNVRCVSGVPSAKIEDEREDETR